jgi:arginine-tRNA-protein transferase
MTGFRDTTIITNNAHTRFSTFEANGTRDGLGNYVVLWLIEQARRLNLPYVYLGYWIADSAKMAYKSRFAPIEGFIGGEWRRLAPGELD